MSKVKITGHASGSGTLTLTGPNTSSDRTITLPDATGTLLSGAGGRRNMIINGAMQVAQRGTSFDADTTSRIYTVDRWTTAIGSTFLLDTTITQSTTVPTGEGFKYSLKVEADSVVSTTSGQNGGIMQALESQDVERLAYGTSSAKSLTLSFWTRSNKTGTYCVQLQTNIGNGDGGTRYSHIKEYTISSADTWEKKTLTFAGHTGQVLDGAANSDGLRIIWWLTSDAADNQTADTWNQSPSFGSTSNQVDFMDSASNEWYLTGCQLELGTAATDFDHRSYGEELALCKRYYQILAEGANNALGVGTFYSTTVMYLGPLYFNTMRATPTFAQTTGTNYYKYYVNSSGNQFDAWTTSWNIGTNRLLLELGSQSKTAGHATMCKTNNSSSKLTLDAEL